jgi:hypothetical protein
MRPSAAVFTSWRSEDRALPPSTAHRRTRLASSSDASKPGRCFQIQAAIPHIAPAAHEAPRTGLDEYRARLKVRSTRPRLDPEPVPRRIRLPDHDGSGCRTTEPAHGPREPAERTAEPTPSHFEPRPHTLSPKDRARRIPTGLKVRSTRPDGITRSPAPHALPGPGSPPTDRGVHQLPGPGSPPTDRALPVACSMHVVIWLVHASNAGCFRSFAR